MEILKAIIAFLDGKKTIIGLILLTIAGHLAPGLAVDLLNLIGGALTGTGLVHKAVKAAKPELPNLPKGLPNDNAKG